MKSVLSHYTPILEKTIEYNSLKKRENQLKCTVCHSKNNIDKRLADSEKNEKK